MMKIKILLITVIAFSVILNVNAQNLTPQASSGQTIIQDLGLGKVTLNYFRPNTKSRSIFGNLVPFGKVWRTGANNATTITFSEEVMVEGNLVPAGKYALFTIPNQNEWTIILNKKTEQWGSYDYKESEDLLRFKVKPTLLKDSVETFAIMFSDVSDAKTNIDLAWQNTKVSFQIVAETDGKVMKNIENAMKSDKKPYFASALYYYNHNKDLNKALEWIQAAELEDNKAPWIKLWKAKIQLKNNDQSGAKKTAKEGLELAKSIQNDEYIKLNKELLDSIR